MNNNNVLGLHKEKFLPGLIYFFVRDEAFGLYKRLLRLYGERNLTVKKDFELTSLWSSKIHGILVWNIKQYMEDTSSSYKLAAQFCCKHCQGLCVVLHSFVLEEAAIKHGIH